MRGRGPAAAAHRTVRHISVVVNLDRHVAMQL